MMFKISEDTIRAVLEKAHQQEPDDFAMDFMAQLRLENRELHGVAADFLTKFFTLGASSAMDKDEVRRTLDDENLLNEMLERCGERFQIANDARLLATALVGIIYKCLKAEVEAKELEELEGGV
tara:strand:+ start:1204 stop:1575 length:372 start_codon:yes stop_codon:yes gene_type:complete